jgi:putative endonuclease
MNFYVYILSNSSRTLYIGVTNDLERRVSEHRAGLGGDFTRRYHCHKLVWYERFGQINDAIACEKKLKGWSRAKKIALIDTANATWDDLLRDDSAD